MLPSLLFGGLQLTQALNTNTHCSTVYLTYYILTLKSYNIVEFDIPTVVLLISHVFCDVTLCFR